MEKGRTGTRIIQLLYIRCNFKLRHSFENRRGWKRIIRLPDIREILYWWKKAGPEHGLSDYFISDAILYNDIQWKSAAPDYPIAIYPRNFIILNLVEKGRTGTRIIL